MESGAWQAQGCCDAWRTMPTGVVPVAGVRLRAGRRRIARDGMQADKVGCFATRTAKHSIDRRRRSRRPPCLSNDADPTDAVGHRTGARVDDAGDGAAGARRVMIPRGERNARARCGAAVTREKSAVGDGATAGERYIGARIRRARAAGAIGHASRWRARALVATIPCRAPRAGRARAAEWQSAGGRVHIARRGVDSVSVGHIAGIDDVGCILRGGVHRRWRVGRRQCV